MPLVQNVVFVKIYEWKRNCVENIILLFLFHTCEYAWRYMSYFKSINYGIPKNLS